MQCDGQYPTCSNCKKAASECIDGDSVRLRDSGQHDRRHAPQRTLINKLRRRISWLESIIREELPNLDLSATPTRDDLEGHIVEEVGSANSPAPQSAQEERREVEMSNLTHAQAVVVPDQRAHDIGLISVGFNADQKYIGPSSGYFLARLLLANSRKDGDLEQRVGNPMSVPQLSIDELVSAAQGPLPLPPQHIAMQLSQVYFETIQPQYPVLHEWSFRTALEKVYHDTTVEDPAGSDDTLFKFQVYMVLAISATIVTCRTKRQISAESYCLSALQYFDRIYVGTSLGGLQAILLLLIFTIHSPHMRLNVWNLNYQCLAAVIDLGLQRQVTTLAGISSLEQELRTRIFWTVFTIDRTIASMMGRPIGLRDEACELRVCLRFDTS